MSRITFEVKCPRNFGTIRKITIYLATLEDGSYLPAPCGGCEFADGSAECIYCMNSLYKMSLKDPTMQQYHKPITP